jgi:hypothetical protein
VTASHCPLTLRSGPLDVEVSSISNFDLHQQSVELLNGEAGKALEVARFLAEPGDGHHAFILLPYYAGDFLTGILRQRPFCESIGSIGWRAQISHSLRSLPFDALIHAVFPKT